MPSTSNMLTSTPAALSALNLELSSFFAAPKAPLPFLHPYAGISDQYHAPTQQNFAALEKHPEGNYQPTAPIFDIEKSNHIFSHIMKTAVILSVEELCSIVPDV